MIEHSYKDGWRPLFNSILGSTVVTWHNNHHIRPMAQNLKPGWTYSFCPETGNATLQYHCPCGVIRCHGCNES